MSSITCNPSRKQHCKSPTSGSDGPMQRFVTEFDQDRYSGLPWIWISMDISMCGYQTSATSMDIYGYLWIFLCDCIRISDITKPQQNKAK